jgi:hypothetical protein
LAARDGHVRGGALEHLSGYADLARHRVTAEVLDCELLADFEAQDGRMNDLKKKHSKKVKK